MTHLNTKVIHSSWQAIFKKAIAQLEPTYLDHLEKNNAWLPGPANIFKAFTLPLNEVNYILFGESPYPRAESAIGYAFWDGRVGPIWSESGLAKTVNRATSLRNFIKMLLVTDKALKPTDTSQTAIANLNKTAYVQTLNELFQNMLNHGFLLLNATLVLSEKPVVQDVKAWRPFMAEILKGIYETRPKTKMILFGSLAKAINTLPDLPSFNQIHSEHPYNVSFITNSDIQGLFKPLHLLQVP